MEKSSQDLAKEAKAEMSSNQGNLTNDQWISMVRGLVAVQSSFIEIENKIGDIEEKLGKLRGNIDTSDVRLDGSSHTNDKSYKASGK
ncbi:uncharacterized protein PGTG_18141 [Puccinia graminis f. sp. tritici CRL 75-36-700-3]|uniref:Uncharacterized protein n=1 Tax=Puccinia graminis f. sp. tritici (strain CRL 75-36-700-3 / race SCCL) TaxID=418459 RepID=E3L676_PUCGT|nr:uncharacterized protein PGTG_18141 [Puccinia graminis f. sp. tritici CRL 75-36-700-3]EFP92051.1 hypothetical protein PGTG_18141 [Puccinia graminis f. sp. tritici CRL 75-36-700-3]